MDKEDFIDEKKRIIYIKDVEEEMGDIIEDEIRLWSQDKTDTTPITFIINSDGGSLDAAFQIIDAIELTELQTIAINTSRAYSAGAYIFMSCDRKMCYPHASFMLHEGITEMNGERTADQLRQWNKFYEKQLEQMAEIVIKNTCISWENIERIMLKDSYFTANDALDWGITNTIMKKGDYNII